MADFDERVMGRILADYHQVTFGERVRLSEKASVVGQVSLGDDVTIFAGAHVRGDCEPIVVGDGTNIQENCSLHVSGGAPLTIGKNVTIGHGAIVHGCTIADNVLIGMGAIVMDHSVINENCLVAAGAVVTENKEFPPNSLIMGIPARAVRTLSEEEVKTQITDAGTDYREVAEAMMNQGLLHEPDKDADIWE